MILDSLTQMDRYLGLHTGVDQVLTCLKQGDYAQWPQGRHELDHGVFGVMDRYLTRGSDDIVWEAHRKYIDVQVVLEGVERVLYAPLCEQLAIKTPYDDEKDAVFFDLPDEQAGFTFSAGQLAIFYPTDVHAPSLTLHGASQPDQIRKIVFKVPVV